MGFLSRSTSDDSSAEPTDEPTSAGVERKLLLALAAAAVGYLLVRRLRSERSRPSLEEVQELTEEVTPGGGSPIPIDEVRDLTDDLTGEDREISIDVVDDESADDNESETGEESLDGDVADEELEQRAEDEIQETPAEPGEITVDDELVDELVDEQDGAAEDDEANETPNAGEEEDEGETDDDGDARGEGDDGDDRGEGDDA